MWNANVTSLQWLKTVNSYARIETSAELGKTAERKFRGSSPMRRFSSPSDQWSSASTSNLSQTPWNALIAFRREPREINRRRRSSRRRKNLRKNPLVGVGDPAETLILIGSQAHFSRGCETSFVNCGDPEKFPHVKLRPSRLGGFDEPAFFLFLPRSRDVRARDGKINKKKKEKNE